MKTAREAAEEITRDMKAWYRRTLGAGPWFELTERIVAAITADRAARPTGADGAVAERDRYKKALEGIAGLDYFTFGLPVQIARDALADTPPTPLPSPPPACTCETFTQDDRNCPRHQGSAFRAWCAANPGHPAATPTPPTCAHGVPVVGGFCLACHPAPPPTCASCGGTLRAETPGGELTQFHFNGCPDGPATQWARSRARDKFDACKSWCGTMWHAHDHGMREEHWSAPMDQGCYCTQACRDAGKPLNPSSPRKETT